ncbi:MAG TPA: FISUMP domain-containing protein [Salinivirgaceae bacterium]|nr:FISUMP domain-containing protein [Salinivirgaceae bacterium]
MNTIKNFLFPMLIMGAFFLFATSCKEEKIELPTLSTEAVIDITDNTAKSGGDITSDGGAAITARGVCWGTNQPPALSDNKTSDGTGTGKFSSVLSDLSPNTTYYVRAYATNSKGTGYGTVVSFTTRENLNLPKLSTTTVTDITETTAKSGGNITSDGGTPVTERGVCWAANNIPTISDNKTVDGTGIGEFSSILSDLSSNTAYYVRAYATNSEGTGYGNIISFITLQGENMGSFTDSRDGNVYKFITIGNQVWMTENLKYLPNVVGPKTGSDSVPYCYVYGYDGADVTAAKAIDSYKTYGVLYNWVAVVNGAASSDANPSGVQGICPKGWHLPSDAEWKQLEMYLGMTEEQANSTGFRGTDEGGKLKAAGIMAHWTYPNTGATNESGFTALPGGYRKLNGSFDQIGYYGNWWSATESDETNAWYRSMSYNGSDVGRYIYAKQFGFSVRCLRN